MIKILLWPFMWPIKWILKHNKRAQMKMRIEKAKDQARYLRDRNNKDYFVAVAGDEVFIGTNSQMKETKRRIKKKLGGVWNWQENTVFTAYQKDTKRK